MFTQSTPSLVSALSGVLPPQAVRALAQALGNCQQPLTHRGPVQLAGPDARAPGGVLPGGSWNPTQYSNLLPPNYHLQMDVPRPGGITTGNWYNTSYGGAQFAFPTLQEFFTNSYYGGPTFNVGGSSTFQNTYAQTATFQNSFTTNSTVNNLNVTTINELPAEQFASSGVGGGGGLFLVEENIGLFVDDADTANFYGGRPARQEVVTFVDVQGSVTIYDIPYAAEFDEECGIRLLKENQTISLDLNNDVDFAAISYMQPVSIEVQP